MHFIDIFAAYWLFVKYIFYVTVTVISLSSIDDLFIDLYYWIRRLYRKLFIYKVHKPFQVQELYKKEEKPLAIMIPAWQEAGVIDKMATLLLSTIEYHDYHVFIGTYPNDPETQAAVDKVTSRYPNIHKVVTKLDGPTNKSDCLNNVIDQIFNYEKQHNMEFTAYILHDAEDVIHPLEFKLFNYLIDRNDMIQIPVIPFERKWYEFTGGHYEDEFAELHGKDLIVRESLLGFIPSAGVGTAINRKALNKLIELHDGIPFTLDTLTEDYNMGFELFHEKMRQIFVRVPVETEVLGKNIWRKPIVKKVKTYVAVREFFPADFHASVRQKTRWIIGIVFQGWEKIGWQKGIALNYFLWRDRKGIVTNFANILGYFIVFNVVMMSLYTKVTSDNWWFPPFIKEGGLIWNLLIANALFFTIRLLHRAYFSGQLYGWKGAVLSIPRAVWGNIINFFAMVNAIKIVVSHKLKGKEIGWNKTTHDFITDGVTIYKRLGDMLLEEGVISEASLEHALEIQKKNGKMLGEVLIEMFQIEKSDLAQAIARQKNLPYLHITPEDVDEESLHKLDRLLLLEHNLLPLKYIENDIQNFVSSDVVTDIVLDQVAFILDRKIELSIAEEGIIEPILHTKLFNELDEREIKQLRTILSKKLLPKSEIEKIISYKQSHKISLIESAQHFGFLPSKQL